MVFLSLVQMDLRFGGSPPDAVVTFDGWFEPLHLVSPYGLFAVMTTTRDEIVIQGSDDSVEWRDYEFRYKPGDVMRRPRWNVPHQPRLDWGAAVAHHRRRRARRPRLAAPTRRPSPPLTRDDRAMRAHRTGP